MLKSSCERELQSMHGIGKMERSLNQFYWQTHLRNSLLKGRLRTYSDVKF